MEGLNISVLCSGLSHPFLWLESFPHIPDLSCGAEIPETLPQRIFTCSHSSPEPGQDQDVPQLCISSPRKVLPTSRTEIWAPAASPCAPGVQVASSPEQETSKCLPGTLLPRSPACSQPGKAIKQEEKIDLSRKRREKAAAIWSWRKQEHNPLASTACCFPLLPRAPPALNASALHRADLLVFSGLQPHPQQLELWSIHQTGSCSSQQRAREVTRLWGNQQLSGDRPCLHHAGFCPCPQSLSPLIPSPQAIPGSSEGVMISLSIYIQPTAK